MGNIGTNVGALSANYYLTGNSEALQNNIRKLSSGSRLSNGGDDAGGVAVSGELTARISRLNAGVDGLKDLVSIAQTSDGFLSTIQQQLTRMSELAQRATNGAFSDVDRANYNMEFERLKTQISQISADASFNGTTLFTTGSLTVSVSADGAQDVFLTSSLGNLTTLGLTGLTIGSTSAAATAIGSLNLAIQSLARRRAEVAADISKFNFHIGNLRSESVTTSDANSKIYDLDVADETTKMSKNNIMLQASTAILAQANTSQQNILTILR
ncbi:MAG: flagellin [Verrucomicrobiota bacterium]